MKNSHLCREDFEAVKDSLSMRQVAEYYGYKVNSKCTCLCPFHNDNRPSLRIYDGRKGFNCFVCGAGGDVITFVSRLYDLRNSEACIKLIEDFALPVKIENLTYREIREREKKVREYKKRMKFIKYATAIYRMYWKMLCEAVQNTADMHFFNALQELSIVEYRLECLKACPEEFCKDEKAVKKIGEIRERIIKWYD